MPAYSDRQRKFMGAELARKRAGKSTKTKMSENQLEEFASMPLVKSKKNSLPSAGAMLKNTNWGDLGVRRQEEAVKVGGFKDGSVVKTAGKI